jgi:hypothetical protein
MSSTTEHEPRTPKWPVCNGTNRFGEPCKARAIQDGLCSVHSGKFNPSLMGKKSRETAAARHAHGAQG